MQLNPLWLISSLFMCYVCGWGCPKVYKTEFSQECPSREFAEPIFPAGEEGRSDWTELVLTCTAVAWKWVRRSRNKTSFLFLLCSSFICYSFDRKLRPCAPRACMRACCPCMRVFCVRVAHACVRVYQMSVGRMVFDQKKWQYFVVIFSLNFCGK